ncbi:hypothetical protein UlMin_031273 [Ulmus minor]
MKVLKEEFSELQIGSSAESLQRLLDSQRELVHNQIDQLQRVVVTQCKLTGVNPLSQEMAAGALSIKIGKRPRDLLNPKAVKYMQSVFSIKDVVSKKESREISALFGVTVTQVREFFASQRSRVKKIARLSREKSIKSNTCPELLDGVSVSSDPSINPVPLNTIVPTNAEEAPSSSANNDALSSMDELDKQFVENIFNLMRNEETFSGQVKLLEWILQIQNSSVLFWFLNKGGVMILSAWLSQAAIEEQTSILFVILKVLSHLPLQKALPVHMSAILQSVNRLRFFRTSDISNRARVLLSKWSKLIARSQAMKKPNGVISSSDAQEELILKQSLSDVISDESWQSSIDIPEHIRDSSENFRKSEPAQTLKLLPAPSDDSNKKHILGVSSSQNRERRKVQLVEQPGQKTAGRNQQQVTRAASVSQSRPLSADDIQKAKMRAQFLQSKYRKTSSPNDNKDVKAEAFPSISQTSIPPVPKVPAQPNVEHHKKPASLDVKVPNMLEAPLDPKPRMEPKESLWEKCRRVQIPWQRPPEMKLDHLWRVGSGENSKEAEVQKNRNRRDKETIYWSNQDIPSNPKEPWDREMDYDDTLTPVIPTEQLPEADGGETQVAPNQSTNNIVTQIDPSPSVSGLVSLASVTSQTGNTSAAEPDLELLAVLLKNPELVFALTSSQAANLPSEQTVKLLDMIKAGGAGIASSFNGSKEQAEEKVEVSLPSPTPSSNAGTSGWRPEAARNPFSQVSRAAQNTSAMATSRLVPKAAHAPLPQQQTAISPYLPQVTSIIPENYPQTSHTNFPNMQTQVSEMGLTMRNSPLPARLESTSTISNMFNTEERQHISTPSNTMFAAQQNHQLYNEPSQSYNKQTGKQSSVSDSWRNREGLPSNYHLPVNQNDYHAPYGAPVQPQLLPGQHWEGSEYVEGDEFESWSPHHSPTRNQGYVSGRNFPETRMNPGYRPDQSRLRNSSGYRDYDRQGNRRWRDRRR